MSDNTSVLTMLAVCVAVQVNNKATLVLDSARTGSDLIGPREWDQSQREARLKGVRDGLPSNIVAAGMSGERRGGSEERR